MPGPSFAAPAAKAASCGLTSAKAGSSTSVVKTIAEPEILCQTSLPIEPLTLTSLDSEAGLCPALVVNIANTRRRV